jgi:hypothetical protein
VSQEFHLAVISPDDRGRFRLGKWMSKDPSITGWRVFVGDKGEILHLEAVRGPRTYTVGDE